MKKFLFIVILISLANIAYSQFIIYQPELIGGKFNYKLVFEQEFYYPSQAKEAGAEGEVGVEFTVGTDGYTSDFKIKKSVHPDLDTAFIEILKRYLWIPGTNDGVDAPMRMTRTHKFKIKKCEKLVKRRKYAQPPYPFTPYNTSLNTLAYKQLQIPIKPSYKGKDVRIHQFIGEYIIIPNAALKQGITGIVELEFVVEVSGRLSNFREISGVGGGCTEEAIRLMQILDWEPGILNDEYVRSFYKISVNFGNEQY